MKNLTPFRVILETESGNITLDPSDTVAFVNEERSPVLPITVNDALVPVMSCKPGDVEGIPDDESPIIVMRDVLDQIPHRRNTYTIDPDACDFIDALTVRVTRLMAP